MRKTKMGLSVGLVGAAIYFLGLFGGYFITVILAGYVLLFEENEWLRYSAVKAVALMMFFSFISTMLGFIPNIHAVIGNICSMFGGDFYLDFLTNLVNTVLGIVDIIEKLLFLGLGVKALNQGTIAVSVLDKIINKYME